MTINIWLVKWNERIEKETNRTKSPAKQMQSQHEDQHERRREKKHILNEIPIILVNIMVEIHVTIFAMCAIERNITIWSNISKLHSYLNMTWFCHASTTLSFHMM